MATYGPAAMSNMPAMRTATTGLAGWRTPPPVRRAARDLAERVTEAQADGIVSATRVEAASYVTNLALHHIGMASELEARLTMRSPLGAARYQLLVDSLTGLAANEIEGLAMKWRFGR